MKNNKIVIVLAVLVVVLAVVLAVVLLGGSKEQEYKLGMGASFGASKTTEVSATIATVVTDKDGKIVSCRLDVAQNQFKAVADGEAFKVDFTRLVTKNEIAYGYMMSAYGTPNHTNKFVMEWFEQARLFEEYVVGMTADEVKALTLKEAAGHKISSDDTLLNAGCTIDLQNFIEAIVKACNDEQGTTFVSDGNFKLGLGVNSGNNYTAPSSATDAKNFIVSMDVNFAATVVVNGKIVATINDAYQPYLVVTNGAVAKDTCGTFAEENNKAPMTKRELMTTYGMEAAGIDKGGSAGSLEWYKQSEIYSNHVEGLAGSQVNGLELGADLMNAGCTITISGINAVVAEAAYNAR